MNAPIAKQLAILVASTGAARVWLREDVFDQLQVECAAESWVIYGPICHEKETGRVCMFIRCSLKAINFFPIYFGRHRAA